MKKKNVLPIFVTANLIATVLFLTIACQGTENLINRALEFEVDTTKVTIGDTIHFTISAHGMEDRIAVFPDLASTESMEIRAKTFLGTMQNASFMDFTLVFWDTGTFYIPEYSVSILNPDSMLIYDLKTDSIEVTVLSTVTGSENRDLKPLKDPIPLKIPISLVKVFLWILFIVLIIVFVLLFRKRTKTNQVEINPMQPYPSGYEVAINKLKQLKADSNVKDKQFYVRLSYILREFIENQWYLRALEMTTNEIEGNKMIIRSSESDYHNIHALLVKADLIKFAKARASGSIRTRDLKFITDFIGQFKPNETGESVGSDSKI